MKSEPLRNFLDSLNLVQQVHSPIHKTGHTLDLVISHDTDNLVPSVCVETVSRKSLIAKRNFSNMDTAAFSDDIKSAFAGISSGWRSTSGGISNVLQHLSLGLFRQTRSLALRSRQEQLATSVVRHIRGTPLRSMMQKRRSANGRICGEERNLKYTANYKSLPATTALK